MIWAKLRAYWKGITATVAGVATALGILWALSGYVVQADDWKDKVDASCVVAQVAKEQSDQALEWQRLQMEREKNEARAERKKWKAILELCLNGTIPSNNPECAKAQAALK
jgi:hypothetical protein